MEDSTAQAESSSRTSAVRAASSVLSKSTSTVICPNCKTGRDDRGTTATRDSRASRAAATQCARAQRDARVRAERLSILAA